MSILSKQKTRIDEREISVVEADDNGMTVTGPFPDELYLDFLNDDLTIEQFVAALVSHVKAGNGAPIYEP